MDDDLEHLEVELRRLRPIAPSPAMRAALERSLGAGNRARIFKLGWLGVLLAATMAAAAVFLLRPPAAPRSRETEKMVSTSGVAPARAVAMFKPVAAENVLWNSRDEGYVTLADGTPARRVRQLYVDTITWQNPTTRASLKWTVPREDVRVVPVFFQ